MKEIRFSQHSQTKLEVLVGHGVLINLELICEIIARPDQLEIKEENKRIAQQKINENLVIRVENLRV